MNVCIYRKHIITNIKVNVKNEITIVISMRTKLFKYAIGLAFINSN